MLRTAFLGKKHTAKTKKKMSDAQVGNKKWLGKKHSEDSKKKMSDARKLYWNIKLDQLTDKDKAMAKNLKKGKIV